MAMDLRLQQKMSQQLVMTPQLQQAIKLLQLSHMEMTQLLQTELEQNPVLEDAAEAGQDVELGGIDGIDGIDGTDGLHVEGSLDLGSEAPENEGPSPNEAMDVEGDGPGTGEPTYEELRADAGLGEVAVDWDSSGDSFGQEPNVRGGDPLPSLEATAAATPSLHAHLRWQLQMAPLSEQERDIAQVLVEEVDDNGYLDPEVVAQVAQALEVDLPTVAAVLLLVQGLEPMGVGCRSLAECLSIQAERQGLPALVGQIVAQHLPQVERRQWAAIARQLGVSVAEVGEAVQQLARLEPHPGRAFVSRPPEYIVPDLFVERLGDGYVISLNEEGVPGLRISSQYRAILNDSRGQTRAYVQDKMRSAVWLLRSVQMRQRTMVRVMQSLLKFQRAFFDLGVGHLRPLVLRDVAEDLAMHESTISRVTSNKYVHTPRGVFELKYFFTSTIARLNQAGDGLSSATVRDSIGRLIAAEDHQAPLSDQSLVELLRARHIDIARRTVAKYREMLRIPPSSQRRRAF